jgi:dephospho-CoA kinase
MTTVLGILGGIGSGKSTIARLFGEFGARVLDADVRAHEVLADHDVVRELVAQFGQEIVDDDGRIVRARLAAKVFGDGKEAELARLNAVIHPRVRRFLEVDLARARRDGVLVVCLDVPLLIESGLDAMCDRLVYVRASPERRAQRCAARGWSQDEFNRREARQLELSKKESVADFIIDNDDDLRAVKARVGSVYGELAGA